MIINITYFWGSWGIYLKFQGYKTSWLEDLTNEQTYVKQGRS